MAYDSLPAEAPAWIQSPSHIANTRGFVLCQRHFVDQALYRKLTLLSDPNGVVDPCVDGMSYL